MSAPLPELSFLLLVLFYLGPAVWGVLCSLMRRRLLALVLLILPYVISVVLWPSTLRFDLILEYPILIYFVPALIGYGIGFFLIKRNKHTRTRGDLIIGFGLAVGFLGFSMMLVDYLSQWILGLFLWAVSAFIVGIFIGIIGILIKTRS